MKRKSIVLWLLAVVLTSCGGDKNSRLRYFNSMETDYSWQDNPPESIRRSKDAHSGDFLCKIDSVTPYSPTFNMKLWEISDKSLRSVHIKAWVKMSTLLSDPQIAVDIHDSTGKSIEWMSKKVKDFVSEPDRWVEASFNLELDQKDRNRRSNTIRIYVSNGHPDVAFADDIEIKFKEM